MPKQAVSEHDMVHFACRNELYDVPEWTVLQAGGCLVDFLLRPRCVSESLLGVLPCSFYDGVR